MSYDSRIDTYEHILKVQEYLHRAAKRLIGRALVHDRSKLLPPEVEMFDKFTPKLRDLEYGSDEYRAATEAMGEALEHHYAHNPHHPEHYPNGIAGMSLLDLLEMLCDWKAASERIKSVRPPMPAAPGRAEAPQYDSNLERSIALNQERWGYSDELRSILTNTARELGLVVRTAERYADEPGFKREVDEALGVYHLDLDSGEFIHAPGECSGCDAERERRADLRKERERLTIRWALGYIARLARKPVRW